MHRDAIFSRSLQILASVMLKKRIILADKSTLTGIVSLTYKKKKNAARVHRSRPGPAYEGKYDPQTGLLLAEKSFSSEFLNCSM